MGWYPKAIRKEIPRHNTPMAGYRAVVLHVAASEAESLYGFFSNPNTKVCSHFYIRRGGVVEQYVDTRFRAPAQKDGNDNCLSIETQGGGAGEWDAGQVSSIVDLIRWANKEHGIPIRYMTTAHPSDRGIAPHRWGIDPYREPGWESWSDSYGKVCPGNARMAQVPRIVELAAQEDDLTEAEAKKLADIHYAINSVPTFDPGDGDARTALHVWCSQVNTVLKQLLDKPGGTSPLDDATIDKIAVKVANLISARLAS